jgi:hypothetical protein
MAPPDASPALRSPLRYEETLNRAAVYTLQHPFCAKVGKPVLGRVE